MAYTLTKKDLQDMGVTDVKLEPYGVGVYTVYVKNKPIKTQFISGTVRVTLTDNSKPLKTYKGQKKAYRRSLPLARVVVAWEKGAVKASEVCYYDPKTLSYVACERSKFWYNHPAEMKKVRKG